MWRTLYSIGVIMRTSRLLLSLATIWALAGSSSAGAQALPEPTAAPQILPEIHIGATLPHYPLKTWEALAVRGVYDMSNGWVLDVDRSFRHVYADLNQTGRVELLPVTADLFVSADGRMAMRFNLGVSANEILLRYTPDGVAAHSVVLTSTLAQR
jgi:hypothetical protein